MIDQSLTWLIQLIRTMPLSGATARNVSHEHTQSRPSRLPLHQLSLEHHSKVKFMITARQSLLTIIVVSDVIGDVIAHCVLLHTHSPILHQSLKLGNKATVPESKTYHQKVLGSLSSGYYEHCLPKWVIVRVILHGRRRSVARRPVTIKSYRQLFNLYH